MKLVLNILKFIVAGWPTRIIVAAAIIPLGAILTIVAMISVIGIPIALALMLLPAAASLYIASEVLRQAARVVWPSGAKAPGLISMGAVVVAVAVAVALAANLKLGAAAKDLIAADFNKKTEVAARIVAITIDRAPDNENFRACNELCLKLLVFGGVDKVLITGPFEIDRAPSGREKAIAARFEDRGVCEKRHYFPRATSIRGEVSDRVKASYAVYEEARRRQDNGICLIETRALLSEAEVIVAEIEARKGLSAAAAGFDLLADTRSATRLSLWRRSGGDFEEVSRRTIVRFEPLIVPAAPTYVPAYGLELKVGFARWPSYLNAKGEKAVREAQVDFAAERLGLDLSGEGR